MGGFIVDFKKTTTFFTYSDTYENFYMYFI